MFHPKKVSSLKPKQVSFNSRSVFCSSSLIFQLKAVSFCHKGKQDMVSQKTVALC